MTKTRQRILEWADYVAPDSTLLLMDGHDSAFLGTVERHMVEPVACYDFEKILRGLMRQGMSPQEAVEFYDFNIGAAWVGPETPFVLNRWKR
jgi:hypothetical protein